MSPSTLGAAALVNSDTKLFKKIFQQCQNIANHIKATSLDQVEILNMTCYFKMGERGRLFFLFCSAVSVAPKFQDAYGFIPSLRTFTRMHSPEMQCPHYSTDIHHNRFYGRVCALCNAQGESCASYAVTYQMLAERTARERLQSPDMVQQKPVSERRESFKGALEVPEIRAKAAAIFSLLDTDRDGRILASELKSGLSDMGYTDEEIDAVSKAPWVPTPKKPGERLRWTAGHSKDSEEDELDGEEADSYFKLDRFQCGVEALVASMSPERFSRFVASVDLSGGALAAGADDAQAGERSLAAKRELQWQLARQLPKLLANLPTVLNAGDLRRILCFEENAEDVEFAGRTVSVCRDCAERFNPEARALFAAKARAARREEGALVRSKIRLLKQLQEQADPELSDYPVGEIPALCTPRIYEALHQHRQRARYERRKQVTAVASRDLISMSDIWPMGRPCASPLPRLPLLSLRTPPPASDEAGAQLDEGTARLMARLGLTHRSPRPPLDKAGSELTSQLNSQFNKSKGAHQTPRSLFGQPRRVKRERTDRQHGHGHNGALTAR